MEEPNNLDANTRQFYLHCLDVLSEGRLPFLVGGAYASAAYTGRVRDTKDLDFFVRKRDAGRALQLLARAGYQTELPYPHWLGKARLSDTVFLDLIFAFGNGLGEVDDEWFEHAAPSTLFGRPVQLMPVEEMIWSKAFVMERERFDGADVAHLILHCAHTMDWDRLVRRFGDNWRVLHAHLVLFGFIYPAQLSLVPRRVLHDFNQRVEAEYEQPSPFADVCRGTLLSRIHYLGDVEKGLQDIRLHCMTPEEIDLWTPRA
ncbi:MAG TPA: nucleotidyltransferase family protein [Candidatus Xenobia bacterium]|jgi:hypothetical protein